MTHAVGFGGVHAAALGSLATVDIAEGRYQDAYDKLKPLVEDPFFHVTPMMWPDFIEAAARSNHAADATAIADRLDERARVSGSPFALGVAARSRAIVSEETEAEPHFRAALEALADSRAAVDLGRAHLTYGEWLRRRKRRRDSSDQLRAAGAVFATTGAEQFVQRTNRELEAIGDRAHAATADRPAGLTSQELTVAELAAEGKTNAEIGATMFLSAQHGRLPPPQGLPEAGDLVAPSARRPPRTLIGPHDYVPHVVRTATGRSILGSHLEPGGADAPRDD